jgi:hypothetical protein
MALQFSKQRSEIYNMEPSDDGFSKILAKIHKDISSGLIYNHTRINNNTSKVLESTSFLYALIELLNEKGLLSIEELDERKKQVAERLVRKFVESGIGLIYQDPEYDKYSFQDGASVDCQSKLGVCKALCCKIPFALSKQDVDERIVSWDFGRPYIIAHDEDGYCVHLNRETYGCAIYEHRPVPCCGFDCQNSEKWQLWLDFDNNILDTEFYEKIKESCKIYEGPK